MKTLLIASCSRCDSNVTVETEDNNSVLFTLTDSEGPLTKHERKYTKFYLCDACESKHEAMLSKHNQQLDAFFAIDREDLT